MVSCEGRSPERTTAPTCGEAPGCRNRRQLGAPPSPVAISLAGYEERVMKQSACSQTVSPLFSALSLIAARPPGSIR